MTHESLVDYEYIYAFSIFLHFSKESPPPLTLSIINSTHTGTLYYEPYTILSTAVTWSVEAFGLIFWRSCKSRDRICSSTIALDESVVCAIIYFR